MCNCHKLQLPHCIGNTTVNRRVLRASSWTWSTQFSKSCRSCGHESTVTGHTTQQSKSTTAMAPCSYCNVGVHCKGAWTPELKFKRYSQPPLNCTHLCYPKVSGYVGIRIRENAGALYNALSFPVISNRGENN